MDQKAKSTVAMAEALVCSTMTGRDASHDPSHAFRVRNLALSLAGEEGLLDPSSLLVVELAALLHDIGDYKYTKDLKEDTMLVKKFLDEEGVKNDTKVKILNIIEQIGFKDEVSQVGRTNSSTEFGVVQDADRLDAMGAIGIARCFTYGGSKNNVLHDPSIPPRDDLSKEKYMSKNEKQTSINHFIEKLLKLKDLMKTKAGQRRAERRHKFIELFLAEFYREWDGHLDEGNGTRPSMSRPEREVRDDFIGSIIGTSQPPVYNNDNFSAHRDHSTAIPNDPPNKPFERATPQDAQEASSISTFSHKTEEKKQSDMADMDGVLELRHRELDLEEKKMKSPSVQDEFSVSKCIKAVMDVCLYDDRTTKATKFFTDPYDCEVFLTLNASQKKVDSYETG